MRLLGVDRIAHDTHGSAAIDLLEAFEDRSQVCFVGFVVSHVVDGEHYDSVDTFFADPLGSGKFRIGSIRVVNVAEFVQDGELLRRGRRGNIRDGATDCGSPRQ